ncbi:MAG TPA: hypothetical protein VFZ54_20535 [Burkholderiales bacterium]
MNMFQRLAQESVAKHGLAATLAATPLLGDQSASVDPFLRHMRIGAGIASATDLAVLAEHEASKAREQKIGMAVTGAVIGGAGLLASGGSLVSAAMLKNFLPAALAVSGKTTTTNAPKAAQPRSAKMFDENGNLDLGGLTNELTSTLLQVALNRGNVASMASALPALPSLPGVQNVGLGSAIVSGARALGLTGAVAGAVGVMRAVGGRLIGFILPSGVKVTRANAVKLAREVGIVAAASALGATTAEVAEAIMEEDKKPRRGRAITSAAVRTTTRTISRIERLHKKIAKVARAHAR